LQSRYNLTVHAVKIVQTSVRCWITCRRRKVVRAIVRIQCAYRKWVAVRAVNALKENTTAPQQSQSIVYFYRIEHIANSAGKIISKSKRRIMWRFGFLKPDQKGINSDTVEYKVMIEFSIISGKRRIIVNDEEIHRSRDRSARFQYGCDIDGHDVQIVCQRGMGAIVHDLSVDGLSFFLGTRLWVIIKGGSF